MTQMLRPLSKYYTHHFSVSLHCAFHQEFLTLVQEATPQALGLSQTLAHRYAQLVAQELVVCNRATAYVSTSPLHQAHRQRRYVAGVISTVVRGHRCNTLPHRRQAAQGLSAMLAPFRGVGRRQYAAATLDVNAMLHMLRQPVCSQWIAALNLEGEVAELERCNQAVADLVERKSRENTARQPQTDVGTPSLRAELDNLYHHMVQVANAQAIALPTEATHSFVQRANGLCATYRAFAAEGGRKPLTPSQGAGEEAGNE